MERFKSAMLFLLVAASLAQSYLLVFGDPRFETINRDGYVETELQGAQLSLEDVMAPNQIVLHLGNQRHTVVYPSASSSGEIYDQIWEFVRQRTFDGFRRSVVFVGAAEWNEIRNSMKGIEVRFARGVPIPILQQLVRLKGDAAADEGLISRIWIYSPEDRDEVRVMFFSDSGFPLYEAVRADVNRDDIERYARMAELEPTYHFREPDYYVPDQPIKLSGWTSAYKKYTVEQLKKSLFIDPADTRNISDPDGQDIYTDGTRVLQVWPARHWFVYSEPIPSTAKPDDPLENIRSAIRFLNQHGLWNGRYLATNLPLSAEPGKQTIHFRQHIDYVPIVSEEKEAFGTIRIVLQNGVVSALGRSFLHPIDDQLRPDPNRKAVELPGGKTLDDWLDAHKQRNRIASVYPAYRPIVGEKAIEFVPVWAVELEDGTVEWLPSA